MRIEDNWLDIKILEIEFISNCNKKINRTIVVNEDWSDEKIKVFILEHLSGIKELNHIDESGYGWIPYECVAKFS